MRTTATPARRGAVALAATLLSLCAISGLSALADASTPNAHRAALATSVVPSASVNPLPAIGQWGVYSDPNNTVVKAYNDATGTDRELLGKVVLRPTVKWFGNNNAYDTLTQTVRKYLLETNQGDPNVLTTMAVFPADPWEGNTCTGAPSASHLSQSRRWLTRFAAAIGSARTAIVLQPDLPLALGCPTLTAPTVQLVRFAAQTFAALPRTTVYLDAGAADWAKVPELTRLLPQAGLRYARGFVLDTSHTDSTAAQIQYGAQVAQSLAAHGFPNRHFIVNTSSNGEPFTYPYYKQHYAARYHGPPACTTRTQTHCVTLGIPPTTDTASPQWRLGPTVRALAARYCDAYMWVGRAWIFHGSFDLQRTLDVARTTPWPGP
jgi:endoglucanase